MQHNIDGSGDVHVVRDVGAHQPETRLLKEVRDVVRRSGEEVVQADDFVTTTDQTLTKVGPEEAGTAGDNEAHAVSGPAGLVRLT